MSDILTYTGITMDPLHPRKEDLKIEDIAHALSMIARANGHFPIRHLVAQHCMECCREAELRGYGTRIQIFCLLHDGAEAYLGDFVSPVKHLMQEYTRAEDQLLGMVYEKFAGDSPSPEEEAAVKEIDKTLLYYEFLELMGRPVGPPPEHALKSEPKFVEKDRKGVEEEFLNLYRRLCQEMTGTDPA